MKRYKTIALTGGLLLCATASALAQGGTWTKVGTPGNTPATSQGVTGIGPLGSITGTFSFTTTSTGATKTSNPDMYKIFIDGAGTFSATTVGTPGSVYDTTLSLYDSNGLGVYFNDDDANAPVGDGATLPALSTLTPLTPGIYYLAIGTFGSLPYSVKSGSTYSYIFPTPASATDFTGVYGPTGSGGTKAIIGWNNTSNDVETGSYTINLTGASFIPAPEPSAGLVLLVGVAGVTARVIARRRSKDASSC